MSLKTIFPDPMPTRLFTAYNPQASVARERVTRLLTAARPGRGEEFWCEIKAVLDEALQSDLEPWFAMAHIVRAFVFVTNGCVTELERASGLDHAEILRQIDEWFELERVNVTVEAESAGWPRGRGPGDLRRMPKRDVSADEAG